MDLVLLRHVYWHSVGMMMGFHAVTLWQNQTFHFLYHMNIIIEIRDSLQLTNWKGGSKHHFFESVKEADYLVEGMLLVSVFLARSVRCVSP
jgi:hypothetical protein